MPQSLTHLVFGTGFWKSASKLPSNLTHLTFGRFYERSWSHLPRTLVQITIRTVVIQNNVAESLLYDSMKGIPPLLTHLFLGIEFSQVHNIESTNSNEKDFPPSLVPLIADLKRKNAVFFTNDKYVITITITIT